MIKYCLKEVDKIDINDIDISNIEIPKIAQGFVVPNCVIEAEIKEAKEKEERRNLYIHNWKVAIFSILGGGIMGFITSFIFWLIEKTP